MRQHHWTQGLFLVGLAMLTAALIPACGGGSSKASSPILPAAGTDHDLNISTVSGIVAVPASSTNLVIRTITFTPTNPNDVILYFSAEGTMNVTASGGLSDSISIVLLDASGTEISGNNNKTVSSTLGSNLTYSLRGTVDSSSVGVFPSTSYTIQLLMTTSSSWSGQIDSVQFKIFTAQNVTVISPSPNIVG